MSMCAKQLKIADGVKGEQVPHLPLCKCVLASVKLLEKKHTVVSLTLPLFS